MDVRTEIDVARQRYEKRSMYLRDPKALIGTTVSDIYSLTMTALATGLFSVAVMITCFILYATNSDTGKGSVITTYPVLDGRGIDYKQAFMFNPTLWCAIALVVPIIASLTSVIFRSNVVDSLSRGSSMTRWLGESLFAPLVLVILMVMWGFSDIFTLVGAFTTNHAAIVFLSMMDVANYPGKKGVAWWPYYASVWLSVLAVLPALLVFVFSSGATSDLPGLLLVATILVLASSVIQVLFQRSYYMGIESPNDKQLLMGASANLINSEVKQLISGSTLKIVALLLMALAYTGSSDWTWRHNQATSCLLDATPVNSTFTPVSCIKSASGLRELSAKKLAAWHKSATTFTYPSDEIENDFSYMALFDIIEAPFTPSSKTTCLSCAKSLTGYWCPVDGTCGTEVAVCGSTSSPVSKIGDELQCPPATPTPVPVA